MVCCVVLPLTVGRALQAPAPRPSSSRAQPPASVESTPARDPAARTMAEAVPLPPSRLQSVAPPSLPAAATAAATAAAGGPVGLGIPMPAAAAATHPAQQWQPQGPLPPPLHPLAPVSGPFYGPHAGYSQLIGDHVLAQRSPFFTAAQQWQLQGPPPPPFFPLAPVPFHGPQAGYPQLSGDHVLAQHSPFFPAELQNLQQCAQLQPCPFMPYALPQYYPGASQCTVHNSRQATAEACGDRLLAGVSGPGPASARGAAPVAAPSAVLAESPPPPAAEASAPPLALRSAPEAASATVAATGSSSALEWAVARPAEGRAGPVATSGVCPPHFF